MSSLSSADHYRVKAAGCREWASKALTPDERADWLKLADQWESLAIEANPSGHLPWQVQTA